MCRLLGLVPNSKYLNKRVHSFIKGKKPVHNLWTHVPKDPNCEICRSCKATRAHCRQKTHGKPDDLPIPKKFADSITADHKILNENYASRNHARVALIILDRFTQWTDSYPCKKKSSE